MCSLVRIDRCVFDTNFLRTVGFQSTNRFGGRIHTLHLPGWPVPIEAGAEFIHGNAPAAWNLIRAQQLTTEEVPEVHREACDGEIRDIDFEQIWTPISDRFQSIGDEDLSLSEFLGHRCADLLCVPEG